MNADADAALTRPAPLALLVVDDEPLARTRMRRLVGEIAEPRAFVAAEAASTGQALELMGQQRFDVLLLDIHMPGPDGLALARAVAGQPRAPAVVFVTAHAEHALTAFELEAIDYLTKPVRAERLQAALAKVARRLRERAQHEQAHDGEALVIQDRGRSERVPLAEVVYIKAELKYLTVRTAQRSYILDGSLTDFEESHGSRFVRVHRNALAARHALRALEKVREADEAEGWVLRLDSVPEKLAVSRRQLAAVRQALAG